MSIDDHRLSTCRSLFHGSFMLHIDPYTVMLLYNLGSPKDAFSAYSTQSSQLCNSICFLFRKWVLNCENWLASSHSLGRATILWPHHGHADPAGVAVGFHHGLGRIKIGHICVTCKIPEQNVHQSQVRVPHSCSSWNAWPPDAARLGDSTRTSRPHQTSKGNWSFIVATFSLASLGLAETTNTSAHILTSEEQCLCRRENRAIWTQDRYPCAFGTKRGSPPYIGVKRLSPSSKRFQVPLIPHVLHQMASIHRR